MMQKKIELLRKTGHIHQVADVTPIEYREGRALPTRKPSRRGLKQRPGAVSPRSAPCLMLTRSQMTWKLLKSRLL